MPCTLPASLVDAAVCRGSFHAVLGGEAGEAVFADFSAALQKAQAEGRILTGRIPPSAPSTTTQFHIG